MTRSGTRPILFALIAAITVSGAPKAARSQDGADGYEPGLRTASGEGIDTLEGYLRWPTAFLQQEVAERYLPAGTRASWETALSYWKSRTDHATVLAFGPAFEFRLPAHHWHLGVGLQPTLFSDYESEDRTLGGPFEFTSHIGLRWRPSRDILVGARVQHTSNAGIYNRNPGIDLFALELGARF